MSHRVLELRKLGQSVWYDDLSRELLRSGELKRLVEVEGVTGVTSNPTIFQKALSAERVYDNDLHIVVDAGLEVPFIYEHLAFQDIREAADLLALVYEQSGGTDGFVSFEAPPALAYDTAKTVAQGKRLFQDIGRPNVMIKVPGTLEGCKAGVELLAAGINVNFTLVFSVDQYRNAVQAYIDGIRTFMESGGDPAAVASVASLFVSRIDTALDQRIKESGAPQMKAAAASLLGKTAIANAKVAYRMYKTIFHGEDFAELKTKGARPQKIVWASTSTKNPDYSDVYYVEALIGPETINTMPATAFRAFVDHGRPHISLEEGHKEAVELLNREKALGIDLHKIMERLQEEGVLQFADSFNSLLDGIRRQRTRLLRGWGHRSASLGNLQGPIERQFAELDENKIAESIWNGNVSIWSSDPAAGIEQRLGWFHIVPTMMEETGKLAHFAQSVIDDGIQHVVLLGMGGSSLTSEVFVSSIGSAQGFPQLFVLDTTVPQTILDVERRIDLAHALFIVASKSGGTIEVMSLFKYFKDKVEQAGLPIGEHFMAITDPGTSLGKLASEYRFRKTFLNPPDIGGRFSALSYFGLAPLALIGGDVNRLLMRARQSMEACGSEASALESPGTWMGAIIATAALHGRDKLTFVISPPQASFGLWLEQLIAESLGKEGKGILPVADEPLGEPGSYGDDRFFVYLRLDEDSTYDLLVSEIERSGQPVITQRVHSSYDLGREMFRWEFSTAVAGEIFKINPFDQPNVQESKDITKRVLAEYEKTGKLPESEQIDMGDPQLSDKLDAFLSTIGPGDYVAINAFIHPSAKANEIFRDVRGMLRDHYKCATTLGFGPRFLHSTGQIHKGGPAGGHFIEITCDDLEDMPIPGEAYSFGVLKSAQAVGDFEALKQKGRPIIKLHAKDESDLEALPDALRKAME